MIRFTENEKTRRFDATYQRTYGKLYTVFLKISKDVSLTKDILQQAYIKLWNKWDELDHQQDLYPLIYTYSRNIFIDEVRKITNRRNMERSLVIQQNACEADEVFMAKEAQAVIAAVVEKMPPRRKEVFLLSREGGFSHKQISRQLSLSANTVERHVQDALIMLKKEVKVSV